MKDVLKSVVSPLWSMTFLILGSGFFMTYISVIMEIQGYSQTVLGYVHSAFYAGLLFGATQAEKFIRRNGHIRAFAAFASLLAATMMVQGLYMNATVWICMRFIAGISLAGLYIVIESWLLAKSTLLTRGRILSIYMTTFYFAQAISQYFLNLMDLRSAEPYLVASILTSISVIPVSLTRTKSPEIQEPTLQSFLQLYKSSPLGFSGCVFSGLILSCIYSFTPIFAQDYNLSVSLMMSLTILGGVILQWPMGKLSDIFDRRTVLLLLGALTIIPTLLLPFTIDFPKTVYALSFVLGGMTFTLYPLSIAQVCDRIEHHNITAITGSLLVAYGVGSALGPLIAPLFMKPLGISGLYAYMSTILGILSCIGIYGFFQRPPVPMEDQQAFVPLPRSTPIAYEMMDTRAFENENKENTLPSQDN